MRRKGVTYLGNEQLAGSQLPLAGIHLPVGVHLGILELFAAVHQGFDLRLHLADIQAGHGELLLNDSIHICQLSTGRRTLNYAYKWRRFMGPRKSVMDPQKVFGFLMRNP